jgi:ubiquinone/menaquinone biosynthesis C-methylase UbiE
VEVGCGAGRLTNALAQDFQTIWALDVSPDRILQISRVPNAARIHPILVDKPVIPVQDNTVDLCTSTHVFQHISDVTVVNAYLQEMFRVLTPGGCILIHVPVVGAHALSGRLSQIVRRRAKELAKDLALPLFRVLMAAGISGLPRIDKYRVFEYEEIYRCLKYLGFSPIEMRFLARAGIHSYIFARKPL